MIMDVDYLERGLSRRVDAAYASFVSESKSMMAQLASKGMAGSGLALIRFGEISVSQLSRWFSDAAQFTFTVTGTHDTSVLKYLDAASLRLSEKIMSYVQEHLKNTGLPDNIVSRHTDAIAVALSNRKIELLDDFEHGMQGSEKLKKDPLVSLVANQTNSPGAVQQVGTGTFSQTAWVQNCAPLFQAIDEAIRSEEFKALSPDQQSAFTDIADALKDEATKSNPDTAKLKRWGNRLLEFSTDVGMQVAASALAQVLARIFIG
jgi:hypothetical protein